MQKNKYNPSFKSQQFTGKVLLDHEGNLKTVLNHPQVYKQFLEVNTREGDTVTFNVTSKRPTRSNAQNSYVWLYLSLISESSGHTPEWLYRWAEQKFLSEGITEVFGDKVRMVRKAKNLNIPEFCEWICRIEDETEIPAPKTEPFLKALTNEQYQKLKYEQQQAYIRMKAKIFNHERTQ